MIRIYAFCGMGKTTLCNNHGYIDDDMFFPNRPTITPNDIVLTNEPSDNCNAYFLPPNYEIAFSKLSKEKQTFFNEYNDLLKNQYDLVKQKYNPTIKEYITNEDIEERRQNENNKRRTKNI